MKLEDLKGLYKLGFDLIYLYPRDKRPLENKWTTRPRKTWKELKEEFDPSYNVGVRLGETSKIGDKYLCCIDVDIKHPKYKKQALKKLKEITHGIHYPTVSSGSGNGSRHLYAVSAEPFKMVEIEKHKDKWEIVVYSSGRQMVLPPSIHPNGSRYEWRDSSPLAVVPVMPKELRALRGGADYPSQNKSQNLFKAVEVDLYSSKLDIPTIKQITEGKGVEDRSAALMSIAMKMCRAGFDNNEILSVLSDENHWIAEAAFDHTQSRSRLRAVKWLKTYTLEKARYETHPLRLFENRPDYSNLSKSPKAEKKNLKGVEEDKRLVLPDLDGNGKPKSSLRNVVHILEHFMEGGLVGFNEFASRPVFLKDTLYGGTKGREVSDTNDLALKHHVACHYRFEPSKEICFEAHTLIAHKYRFHPVKAYLESVEWDGTDRLDGWLREAFCASGPRDYVSAISRKVLIAAVARIYDPGCKFDYMTVLEGNQGEGKSMSLGILVGPEWFVDRLGDISNKDVIDQMLGKWLIEVSELDNVRGREAEAVKAFISRQVDRARLSYARRAQDYPRQCIFIGSTNDQEYLTDETGNRRYWPVRVGIANRKWLKENRDQLWAEAKFRYELDEKLYLPPELEVVARGEQEKRFEVDVWEPKLKEIVAKSADEVFQTVELWKALHDSPVVGFPNMTEAKRIGRIMHRLRYVRITKRVDGILSKCWIKP